MKPRVAVACLLLLSLSAVACSGGGGGSAGGTKATGKPLVIGLMNMENTPIGSFPEFRRDAEAAVRYVNEELGGIHNRPIQLEACITNSSPESAQACANELRIKQPVAVVAGPELSAGPAMTIFENATIPYVGLTPAIGDELSSTASFMLAGGVPGDLLAEMDYITGTLMAKKVGIVHLDLPGLVDNAVLAARIIMRKRGVTDAKIVAEKADAADFVPAVRAATASNPDVLMAVFPAQGCARVLQAAQALKVKARIFMPSACASEEVLSGAGSAANGVTFATGLVPYTHTDDPQVATFLEKRQRYGAGTAPSVLSQMGFATVMDVHKQLSSMNPDAMNGPALSSRLQTRVDEPNFMAHPFTCDAHQVLLVPSVCNAWARLVQYRDGTFVDVVTEWVNGGALVKLALEG
ncbi:MAG: ABC transporter substrate-binding protein [Acidimicrobiales bacterium]